MILDQQNQELYYKGRRFYIGQNIVATDQSEYEGLFGFINEIRTGKDKETKNKTPDIYCFFDTPDMPCDRRHFEELFSRLYGEPRTHDEIALDCVIMAPEMIEPLDSPRVTQKVYVVVEDWAHDDDRGFTYTIFTSLKEARKQMRLTFKKELEDGFLTDQLQADDFIVASADLCYEAYQEGYADAEHYMLYVEERMMAADETFISSVCGLQKNRNNTR